MAVEYWFRYTEDGKVILLDDDDVEPSSKYGFGVAPKMCILYDQPVDELNHDAIWNKAYKLIGGVPKIVGKRVDLEDED